MPVDVVLDGPAGRRLRAAARRGPTILGALLVCCGAAAVLPVAVLTVAVVIYTLVWLDFRSHPEKVWPDWFEEIRGDLVPLWLLALATTSVGFLVGLRLLRGNRNLILFLRRFRYDPATSTVTEAVSRLGDFWRFVTLDDDRIKSRGAGDAVEDLVETMSGVTRSFRAAAPTAKKMWRVVMRAALVALGVALCFVLAPGPDWTSRLDRLPPLIDLGHNADGGAALGARLCAAVLLVGIALAALWYTIRVTGRLLLIPVTLLYGGVARGVRDASDAEQLYITQLSHIPIVAQTVELQSHKVFGARLSVLTVASEVWQQTVAAMADICELPLIDISEPTGNVMWEIEELERRFGDRCVFIGAYTRLQDLISHEPDDVTRRLLTFLEGRQVLAYTAGAQGTRRFVRALSSTLDRHARRPLPPHNALPTNAGTSS
jgi:hypothetical protein